LVNIIHFHFSATLFCGCHITMTPADMEVQAPCTFGVERIKCESNSIT
jgi:hypothetical protein